MLKRISLIAFLFVQVSFAQNLLTIFSDGGLTNPVTENLQIDVDCDYATTSAIPDQSGNNRNITLYNSPTINTASLNGFNTLTFNGTDEYGEYINAVDFFRTEPYTMYIVFKVVSGTSGRVFDNRITSYQGLLNIYSANTFSLYSGTHLVSNTATISNWMIVTCVFNGASSIIKINSGADKIGNEGGTAGGQLRIASKGGTAGGYANIELARVLSYSGAHDEATRTQMQNYLNELYGVY